MKIAYLSTFYPYRGGIAQFNASLFRAFEASGHEVKPFTFTLQYPEILFPGETQLATENDKVDKIDALRSLSTINPFSYYSTYRKIASFKPDLLVMKYWMPFFAPSLGSISWLLKRSGVKVISILDNVIPHEKRIGDSTLNRFFLSQNSGFVTMSSSVTNDLFRLKKDAKQLFHPHPLYNHFGEKNTKESARLKLGVPTNKKVLLFFGLIRKYKGLDLLIEAFNLLSEDYYLLIAGEPYENFDKYKDAINQNKNKENIKVNTSYIPDEEVGEYFSASDVCVLPYKSATQSGIVSISHHFDLPVIVTNVGSLKEMVKPYDAGIVIESPEVNNIKNAIEEYFIKDSPQFYIENIRKFKEKYSWEGLASQIVKFSEKL